MQIRTECLSSFDRAGKRQKAVTISELRQKFLLKDLLQLSGFIRSTFYYCLKHNDTDKYKREKQEIINIFNANKAKHGHRRVLTVSRNKGYVINHKAILKLMKSLSLKGQRKNDKYH